MIEWLRAKLQRFDIIRIGLIILLIVVSTGHVGRLFADREAEGQTGIGYVLALGIDGVLAVALYEVIKTEGQHRRTALAVFLLACGVSGGFNVSYYRIYHPVDPVWTSILLGLTAPVLAASVAVLKSFGDVERERAGTAEREAERQAQMELEKYRIQQAEETKRLAEAEKTRRAEERTKQQRVKAKAEAETKAERERKETERRKAAARQDEESLRQILSPLGNANATLGYYLDSPASSRVEAAESLGTTRQTVSKHLGMLESIGVVARRDGKVNILVDEGLLREILSDNGTLEKSND